MDITVELSLYPLKEVYEEAIINFIKALKQNELLEVHTTPMSSYIVGESTSVFAAINKALCSSLADVDTAALVMKVLNRKMPISEGFINI